MTSAVPVSKNPSSTVYNHMIIHLSGINSSKLDSTVQVVHVFILQGGDLNRVANSSPWVRASLYRAKDVSNITVGEDIKVNESVMVLSEVVSINGELERSLNDFVNISLS